MDIADFFTLFAKCLFINNNKSVFKKTNFKTSFFLEKSL